MQIADHFFDNIEMNVYQALYFEPLCTIFPEFRGPGLVGGILVDLHTVSEYAKKPLSQLLRT